MQAADNVGPKILSDLTQGQSRVPVALIYAAAFKT
jgi:hypothetical protein